MVEVLLERDVSDGELPGVGDEVGGGARLIGVAHGTNVVYVVSHDVSMVGLGGIASQP